MTKVLAVCAAGATALSTNHRSSGGNRAKSSLRVAALEKAEEAVFLKRRPAHPHFEETEPPEEVQSEVEGMMKRVEKMGDKKLEKEYVEELEGVEASLAERVGAAGSFASKKLVSEVGTMRANLCLEQGFERHETADCETFMRVACSLDGNGTAASQPAPVTFATCQQFFQEYRRETGKEEPAEGEAEAAAEEGGDDAAAEEGGNETAPEGLFGGKLERDLPEQGYNEYENGHTHKVQHNNLETWTGDWQKEGRGRDMDTICKEFPNNQWCQLHTFTAPAPAPPPPPPPAVIKSGATSACAVPMLTAFITAAAVVVASQ